jgi:hypothetical protein
MKRVPFRKMGSLFTANSNDSKNYERRSKNDFVKRTLQSDEGQTMLA